MKRCLRIGFVTLLFALTLSSLGWAQWSSDPNQNLALSDIPGADQVQPKLATLPDSSWYVSWFNSNPNDPPPIGYDTYLQRLNPNGFEQFPHDGLQVAKLTNSSTEDYGLDVDAQGNALLAFLDTREGANQQVTAAKISPTGEALWGPQGVQLTAGNPSAHQPKIVATSDGGAMVKKSQWNAKPGDGEIEVKSRNRPGRRNRQNQEDKAKSNSRRPTPRMGVALQWFHQFPFGVPLRAPSARLLSTRVFMISASAARLHEPGRPGVPTD